MNVLTQYYARVVQLNKIWKIFDEKRNENDNLRKLCSRVVVCCRINKEHILDELTQRFTEQNVKISSSNYSALLKEIRILQQKEGDRIFRLAKLKSPPWKSLHECVGDELFQRLLVNCDIFMTTSNSSSFIQLVGIPLFKYQNNRNTIKRKLPSSEIRPKKYLKTSDNTISARKILYSKDLRENVRNLKFKFCTRCGQSNVSSMVKEIFGVELPEVENIFVDLMRFYRRNRYRGLLDCQCPLPDNFQNESLADLIQCFIPEKNVKSYVWSLFKKLIPEKLLGSSNLVRFVDLVVNRFIEFRKYDVDNLRSYVDLFKMKNCSWLWNLSCDNETKRQFIVNVTRWLLHYTLHLLRRSFYVTESQFMKHRLLFYRKPIWGEIRRKASVNFINKCRLERVRRSRCRLFIDQYGPFGLRFVPKRATVRPILTNCDDDRKVEKMNNLLKPALAVLQHLRVTHKELFGSTIADFDSIRTTWKEFIKRHRYTDSKCLIRPLYFVKVDVDSCFDNMLHSVLTNILETTLKPHLESIYGVQSYCILLMKNGKISRSYRQLAWPAGTTGWGLNRIDEILSKSMNKKKLVYVVQHDQPTIISRDEILDALKTIINEHIVKFFRKFYVQKQGIAQGSVLSVVLCNLYFTHLEKQYFRTFLTENDLLMRHVDDFLFVTPDKDKAAKFVKMFLDGFPDYNVSSSPEKVALNFNDEKLSSWILMTDGNDRGIPWCGLNFHPVTGEVSMDDVRWHSLDARDSLTLNFCTNADDYVKQKLLHYLTTKVQTICFDDEINSLEIIAKNIKSHFQFIMKCFDGFKAAYSCKRLRITAYEVAPFIARKMKALVNKSSPKLSHGFSVIELTDWFLHIDKRYQ